eukprot:CAMPEP_0172160640 /NCGR_PEP_ID=MMETSP1050-20130122/5669_1 /TAXON_ID=233186 /ORGANISM="Cryptomonas curvata, Strain CCAP979/52" /LENGTH=118 /DNA_ID=CAMNT_0012830423 /DNA_START=409 /DNA_END=766 /DNA_ORIENTATION=+
MARPPPPLGGWLGSPAEEGQDGVQPLHALPRVQVHRMVALPHRHQLLARAGEAVEEALLERGGSVPPRIRQQQLLPPPPRHLAGVGAERDGPEGGAASASMRPGTVQSSIADSIVFKT